MQMAVYFAMLDLEEMHSLPDVSVKCSWGSAGTFSGLAKTGGRLVLATACAIIQKIVSL